MCFSFANAIHLKINDPLVEFSLKKLSFSMTFSEHLNKNSNRDNTHLANINIFYKVLSQVFLKYYVHFQYL